MKQLVTALCIVAICSPAFSQSPSEDELYAKLTKGNVEALDALLKKPDECSALLLYTGAGVAFKEKKLEDAAFLFYAGQLRARFDQKCFPPQGTGGDNPFVLFAALSRTLGSSINPAVMAEPEIFSKALERIGKWSPKAPDGYSPGYKFKERLSEKDAHEAAGPNRIEFLARMGELSKLLSDAEYFAAYQVVRAHNLATGDNRPTAEEYENATAKMKRIETEKGLKGFFSK